MQEHHEHCGCGCGHDHDHGHHHHPHAAGELTPAEEAFLHELSHHHYLPVARFLLESSREPDFTAVALAPVYLRHKGEEMAWVKGTGKLLEGLEEKGCITLDYGYALQGYPYTEYKESDLYAYFCKTTQEAQGKEGFLGDTPVLELGSIAPAAEA